MKTSFGGTPAVAWATIRALQGGLVRSGDRLRGHNNYRRSVAQLRGISGRHGAGRVKARLQLGQRFETGVGARAFVAVDQLCALGGMNSQGYDFASELARRLAPNGSAMTFEGKGVLIGARDGVSHGNVIGLVSHRAILKRTPESVVEHRVDRLPIAEFPSLSHASQQIGSTAHALHAAGDDDLGVAGADRLVGQHDGFQPRATHLVHARRGHGRRQSGGQGGLPGRCLPNAGRQNVPQNHFVDPPDIDSNTAERSAITGAASSGAVRCDRAPWNFPSGVRQPVNK